MWPFGGDDSDYPELNPGDVGVKISSVGGGNPKSPEAVSAPTYDYIIVGGMLSKF